MSNVNFLIKKYCPFCFYTKWTEETHCPKVADNLALHKYHLSVPLLECKPDTSTQHKHERRGSSINRTPRQDVLNNLQKGLSQEPTGIPIRLIRNMQQKAAKDGKIPTDEDYSV